MEVHELTNDDITAIKATFIDGGRLLERRDIARWADGWTEDCVLIQPGHARVDGRERLIELGRAFPRLHDFEYSDWRIEGREDLAVVTNHVRYCSDDTDGQHHGVDADQLAVLRKQDGQWKTEQVVLSSSIPDVH